MARRRRGSRSFKIPVLSIAAIAVPAYDAYLEQKRGGNGLARYVESYTGYNATTRQWTAAALIRGWAPPLVVGLAKRMIGPLARLHLPKFIPISLS